MIKRYRHAGYDDGYPAFCEPDGDWVKYEDVKHLIEKSLTPNKDLAKSSIIKDCAYCFFKHYRRQDCMECLGCHNCSHFKPVPDNFQKPWEEK